MTYGEFRTKLSQFSGIEIDEKRESEGEIHLTIAETGASQPFLELIPNDSDLVYRQNYSEMKVLSFKEFLSILKLINEFMNTPVEKRLDSKPKYYVLDEDLGHITDVSLTPSSLTVHYATNAEKQDINPALLFTLLCSEYVAVTNVFKSTSITRVTNKTKVTYDPDDTKDSQRLISQLIKDTGVIKDTGDDDNESFD